MTDTHTTAHIPDEAVQAANLAYCRTMDATDDFNASIRSAIIAALPHLSAPCAVEVIQLDWAETSYGTPEVFTEVGVYRINHAHDGGWSLNRNNKSIADHDGRRNFADQQKAKAAAQADFERRILSCVTTKPFDVAVVREQCAQIAEDFRDKHWIAHDIKIGIFPNRSEAGIAIADAIRALSPAEPAHGEQWQSIELVGYNERLIIIGSYNAKGSWCAEVWHTKYLRDQQAKSADGFFMNAPHLEWVPTHFMELPAAPTTEAGK